MSMPFSRRRNQEPEPVRPGSQPLARGTDGVASPIGDPTAILSTALADAKDEAARWKRHADTYADERDTAVKAFNAKVSELDAARRERDGAYGERAQLLAWLASLHPSTTVITTAADVTDEDGWQLLYLVAGGWQMSWHIAPRDTALFKYVTAVEPSDERAKWDGHDTEQKYERIRGHVRLLALDALAADGASTGVTANSTDIARGLRANWARFRGHVLNEVWEALRDAEGGPLTDGMTVVNGLLEQAQTGAAESEALSA